MLHQHMNKLFEKYGLSVDVEEQLSEVTTNLQDANSNYIVFYRLLDNEKSQVAFQKRLKGINPGLLILSHEPISKISIPYVVLPFEKFLPFQKELCDILYPQSFEVKLIGVTGTNGKSTVVHLCHEILKANNYKSFTIGTIGIFDGEKEIHPAPGATTPSYVDLRRVLHKLHEYDFACLEVSSHALDQDRLNGITLACAGWTNLTQDHLDYHGTMEEYFHAKSLIKKSTEKDIVIPHGESDLENLLREKSLSYKVGKVVNVEDFDESFKLEYNKRNLSVAISLVEEAIGKKAVIPKSISLPKGRYNTFRFKKSLYVVDYAHTPDAIENVVGETKKAFPNAEIITIFGCGGDRDRKKRPLMLEAALKYSDKVVVTTDNPRTEKPEAIIKDAVEGREDHQNVTTIVNRKEAIERYVRDYSRETIVVIAGKGHEEYQEVNGVKNFFSDIETVKNKIKELS